MQQWNLPYTSSSLERVLKDMMSIESRLESKMFEKGIRLIIETKIEYNIDEDIWEGTVTVTYAEESR